MTATHVCVLIEFGTMKFNSSRIRKTGPYCFPRLFSYANGRVQAVSSSLPGNLYSYLVMRSLDAGGPSKPVMVVYLCSTFRRCEEKAILGLSQKKLVQSPVMDRCAARAKYALSPRQSRSKLSRRIPYVVKFTFICYSPLLLSACPGECALSHI